MTSLNKLPVIKAYTVEKRTIPLETNQEPNFRPNSHFKYVIPKRTNKPVNHFTLKINMTCSEGLPNDQYNKLTQLLTQFQKPTRLSYVENTNKQLFRTTFTLLSDQQNPSPKKRMTRVAQEELLKKIDSYRNIIDKASMITTGTHNDHVLIKPAQMQELKSLIRSRSTSSTIYKPKGNTSHRKVLHSKMLDAADGNQAQLENILKECRKTYIDKRRDTLKPKNHYEANINTFNDTCQLGNSNEQEQDNADILASSSISNISPVLQRKQFIHPNLAKYPTIIYYNYDNTSLSQEEIAKLHKQLKEESKMCALTIIKLQSHSDCLAKIQSSLYKKPLDQYDLTILDPNSLDLAECAQIYLQLHIALQPHAHSIAFNNFNYVDTDIAELLLKDGISSLPNVSNYDMEFVKSYENIMTNSITSKSFIGFWQNKKSYHLTPTSRQHALIVYDDANAYMFGGLSSYHKSDLWQLTQNGDMYEWKSLSTDGIPAVRYGCNGCVYKGVLYILFGCGDYLKQLNSRLSYNDINMYDIAKNKWSRCPDVAGECPTRKAFAASCLMDNGLFIHGGNNGSSRLCYSTIQLLDLGSKLIRSICVERYNSSIQRPKQ